LQIIVTLFFFVSIEAIPHHAFGTSLPNGRGIGARVFVTHYSAMIDKLVLLGFGAGKSLKLTAMTRPHGSANSEGSCERIVATV
jgi:hypothetical protein